MSSCSARHRYVPLKRGVLLTLICCPLDPSALPRSQLLLAVSSHSSQAHIFSSGGAHASQQVWVVDGAMCAIRRSYRGGDVSRHLRSAQHARSPRARTLLQRSGRAVPLPVPEAEQTRSSLHCMATSECRKAASGVAWRVLEEDVVLGFGAEVRHSCEESGLSKRQL